MPPDIRPMRFVAPEFRSYPLVKDALESQRAHRARLTGRYMLDRVLLFEHGFHFGKLVGLEVDKLR